MASAQARRLMPDALMGGYLERVTVALVGGVRPRGGLAPVGALERRHPGVSGHLGVYGGEIDAVGERERLPEDLGARSEERRVGKECGSRGSREREQEEKREE